MDFGISLKEHWCKHYKCWATFNYLKDAKPLFKVRDDSNDRDFCVYFVYNEFGKIVYIGQGRYWDYKKYGKRAFWKSRPFTHNDFLSKLIKSNWKIAIIHCGLTDLESKLLEAYYIFSAIASGRKLTKQNANRWDRTSLINKRREMVSTFYKLANIYLRNDIWKSLKIYY